MPKNEFVSISEFARRIGAAKSEVSRGVKSGRIQLSARKSPQGFPLINWTREKGKWEANRTDSRKGQGSTNIVTLKDDEVKVQETIHDIPDVGDDVSGRLPGTRPQRVSAEEKIEAKPGTYQYYATKKVKADAERNNLKYLQELQELVPFDDAIGIFYTLLVSVRDGVMAMAARNTGLLAAEVRGLVKEFNEDGNDKLDAMIRNAFDKAGRTVLAEVDGYQKKDFKEAEVARKKAQKRKTRK